MSRRPPGLHARVSQAPRRAVAFSTARSSASCPAVPRPRRAAALGALHRRARARGRAPRRRRAERARGSSRRSTSSARRSRSPEEARGDRRRVRRRPRRRSTRDGLDANVSVKPTGARAQARLRPLPREPRARRSPAPSRADGFVRIDMEDASTTDDTLRLYRELRDDGLDTVGVVLQASLRRHGRRHRGARRPAPSVRALQGHLRRVRGDRVPGRTRGPRELRARARGARSTAAATSAIATHDEWLVDAGAAARRASAVSAATSTSSRCSSASGRSSATSSSARATGSGSTSRTAGSWYEYSLRRLQENPKIAGYIAADTINRFIPGR